LSYNEASALLRTAAERLATEYNQTNQPRRPIKTLAFIEELEVGRYPYLGSSSGSTTYHYTFDPASESNRRIVAPRGWMVTVARQQLMRPCAIVELTGAFTNDPDIKSLEVFLNSLT
jgi:hypothetical protein